MRTFKEMWQILTTAYVNGKVDPWDCHACFVGNMLDRSREWANQRRFKYPQMQLAEANECYCPVAFEIGISMIEEAGYTRQEIADIEANFLKVIDDNTYEVHSFACITLYLNGCIEKDKRSHPNYKNALFLAFESCLEMLRKIHESKGEIIDLMPEFKKRQLVAA